MGRNIRRIEEMLNRTFTPANGGAPDRNQVNDNPDSIQDVNVVGFEATADTGVSTLETITTSGETLSAAANQVSVSFVNTTAGKIFYVLGAGPATTSNDALSTDDELVLENYTGDVSFIRQATTGTLQVNTTTRS